MSKSTIVDGRDNQEVTGVTAEGRGEQGNSCLQRSTTRCRLLSRDLRRAFTLPRNRVHNDSRQNENGSPRDDEREQDRHVHIVSLVLCPLQHYHEAIERLRASQESSEL